MKKSLAQNTGSVHDLLIDSLQNKKTAEAYLKVALEEYQNEGNSELFLLALRNIAEAHGGIGRLAQTTHLNRQSLYQTLSGKGNPRLITLNKILHALGFQLSVNLSHPPH